MCKDPPNIQNQKQGSIEKIDDIRPEDSQSQVPKSTIFLIDILK